MQKSLKESMNQKDVKPDAELLLWEKWVQIRNEETKNIANKLDRVPADLTMNLLEKVREEKEWKTVLEHAKIEQKPSIRGRLWEQPQRLKQDCYCTPVYEIHRTPAEKGKPKVIEHISVPKYIQEVEKGLSGTPKRVKYVQAAAEFVKYRKKREQELSENIQKIDPFRPDASELLVKGTKIKIPATELPKKTDLPTISITQTTGNTEDTLCNIYAVRINNTIIIKYIPHQNVKHIKKMQKETWHESCTTWSYYFNSSDKKSARCKIFLQNIGTVTLRYCWKKIKRSIPFIPEDIYEQVFFFNKNEDVLSPGQIKEIYFTFVSNKPGIFNEFWELSFCNICFYDTTSEKLSVQLYADAVENFECDQSKVNILKHQIITKAKYNVVYGLINDIIDKATTIEPQQYPYQNLFLEREMFEMKNPVCFYHQTEITKMKDLFSEMINGKEWNLSIASWRNVMMKLDYEDRMKYYELLKKSHVDLLKPWYEGENLLKEKHRAVQLILAQMADKFDKKYSELKQLYILNQSDQYKNIGDQVKSFIVLDSLTQQKVSNVFFIHAYDYVGTAIELSAGVLSSLDLNRWIDFDFCQS